MKRTVVLIAIAVLVFPLFSCDKLNKMLGGKKAEEEKVQQAAEKLKELEEKMKKMEEADEKKRQEDEMRAKLEQEIREEIKKETESKTEKPAEKVVVLKEKAPVAPKEAKPKGWIKLCDESGFGPPCITISLGQNVSDLNHVSMSGAGRHANDMCASVRHNIPSGWSALVYYHPNYRGDHLTLSGAGGRNITNNLNDQCSSVMWTKQ